MKVQTIKFPEGEEYFYVLGVCINFLKRAQEAIILKEKIHK